MKMHIWDVHRAVIYNTEKLKLNQVARRGLRKSGHVHVGSWGHSSTGGGTSYLGEAPPILPRGRVKKKIQSKHPGGHKVAGLQVTFVFSFVLLNCLLPFYN